eukprot:358109-Chlamydomonas_euryale.AAC.1
MQGRGLVSPVDTSDWSAASHRRRLSHVHNSGCGSHAHMACAPSLTVHALLPAEPVHPLLQRMHCCQTEHVHLLPQHLH